MSIYLSNHWHLIVVISWTEGSLVGGNREWMQCRGFWIAKHDDDDGWRRSVVVSGVRRMNEVNARRARLVLGCMTVFGRVYHIGI